MTVRGTNALLAELDGLGLAAWSAAPDTLRITHVTAAGRALLGLDANAPFPVWPELLHPDHRATLERSSAGTFDHQLRNGRWIRVELRPLDGELLAVAMGTSDLRDAATRAAEAQLDALVDNLPFDFFELDMRGQYVRQNAAAKRMWGDNTGLRVEQVPIPEETRRLWAKNNARAYAGEVIREEVEMLVGIEMHRMVQLLSPVREVGGAIRGILGMNIDITARRQAEQQREKLAVELKKSLEALDQAQLRLVARERLAALGELAAVVAHEVRNPLGSIFNALTQMKKQAAPEPMGLLTGIIDEEASRLDQMVRSLLSYARPFHPHLVAEPLEPILSEALNASIRAQSDPCPVKTRIEVSPSLGPVMVDSQLLRMALTNIFDNALQAMPSGGELTVVAAPEARDGKNWAEVQVRDTGRGIRAEVLPRIFEPFFTTRAAGTGLGLAVVRRVVEAHQGAVVALSQPGEGATFALYLPR